VPPNKFEGRKTPILPIFGPKIDTLTPPFPNAVKVGKSKTIMSIFGYVSMSILNMVGVPHPPLRSAVPLVCGVEQVNFESI